MAEAVTGGASDARSLPGLVHPSGAIGEAINSTYWGVLALRQASQPGAAARERILRAQANRRLPVDPRRSADTDDTGAAVQALVAAGVRGKPIARASRSSGRGRIPTADSS